MRIIIIIPISSMSNRIDGEIDKKGTKQRRRRWKQNHEKDIKLMTRIRASTYQVYFG